MKKSKLFWLIPVLLILIFLIKYYIIINYLEKMFVYTDVSLAKTIMLEEKMRYKVYLFEKSIFVLLQFIASILCINIGLLFFNYTVKLKKILKIVLQSFFAIIIVQTLLLVTIYFSNYSKTISNFENIEQSLYLINYLKFIDISSYLILPLQLFNLTHSVYFLILTLGIQKIINKNYIQSLYFTLKTYGTGVSICFVFAMIMEMNFN